MPITTAAPGLPTAGWLLYDGDCRFCTSSARRVERLIGTRGFAILPLQTPWVQEKLGLTAGEPLREMIVLTRDGRRWGGADAALHLAGRFWWSVPLTWLAQLPGVRPCLRRGYAWLAVRRSCAGGACALSHHAVRPTTRVARWLDALPLLLLPGGAIVGGYDRWSPWVFMLLLAGAIFAGCKWLTWRVALRAGPPPPMRRSLGYLFAWVGMDAANFLRGESVVRPGPVEWLAAVGKTILGVVLVWVVLPFVPADAPMLAGWLGIFGLILALHFGVFHLLALGWRSLGVEAQPLMRAPLFAPSLANFWGRRWNAAFHELVARFVFRPFTRHGGATGAMLAVFLVSGLVHDLVISLPARGGYGLPTAYFLLQGAGILVERSRFGRSLGLGRGIPGHSFTLLLTIAPAAVLFHPPFVRGVILPMLDALGAR